MNKWFVAVIFLILLESSKTQGQDERLKLCGREFIRMVVTSCGSSRVKRNTLDSGLHHAYPHRVLFNWLSRDFRHQKEAQTGEDEQWRQPDSPKSVTMHPATHRHTSPPAENLEHSTIARDISISSRSRRDVGPAGVCCTSGCTLSELIQYC